jgi:hypothetical protein
MVQPRPTGGPSEESESSSFVGVRKVVAVCEFVPVPFSFSPERLERSPERFRFTLAASVRRKGRGRTEDIETFVRHGIVHGIMDIERRKGRGEPRNNEGRTW